MYVVTSTPKTVLLIAKQLLTCDGRGTKYKRELLKSIIKRVKSKNRAERALNWLVEKEYRVIKYDDGFMVINPKLKHSTIAIGITPLQAIRKARRKIK